MTARVKGPSLDSGQMIAALAEKAKAKPAGIGLALWSAHRGRNVVPLLGLSGRPIDICSPRWIPRRAAGRDI
jgi:hypothetical protein